MTLSTALSRGRRAAVALMTDACRVERPGEPVTGTDPAATVTRPLVTVYEGRVRLQSQSQYEQGQTVAEATYIAQRYLASFPVGSFDPRPGDILTVTAASFDASLVGRSYRIAGPFGKSHATSIRVFIDEQSPEVSL